jgi:predicted dinucleotide-utilizing enzyme
MDVVGATGEREISRRMVTERASQRAFFGVSALLFAASATVTIVWCASMSAMGEMQLPALARAVPMVVGVVTAAITVERLALAGEHVARAIGAVFVGAGLLLIARAGGLG